MKSRAQFPFCQTKFHVNRSKILCSTPIFVWPGLFLSFLLLDSCFIRVWQNLHLFLTIRWLQVHPYTYRNENQFLHFNFGQDPYMEFDYWINKVGVDGLFTDFTGSLHNYQEWTSPNEDAYKLLHKIASMISKYGRAWGSWFFVPFPLVIIS